LRNLAGGDLTRFDEIAKLSVWMVFNDLSFELDKDNLEKTKR
jgi:hypothetical protein